MARFASVAEFSPAGTVIAPGTVNSNPIKTEAAKDARAFVHVTVVGAGATLDIEVQISHDLTRWATVAAFNQITATGDYVLPLPEEKLGTHTRLRYVGAVDSVTLQAVLEKKTGV